MRSSGRAPDLLRLLRGERGERRGGEVTETKHRRDRGERTSDYYRLRLSTRSPFRAGPARLLSKRVPGRPPGAARTPSPGGALTPRLLL